MAGETKSKRSQAAEERRQRLARALRDNLNRRKRQARARDDNGEVVKKAAAPPDGS